VKKAFRPFALGWFTICFLALACSAGNDEPPRAGAGPGGAATGGSSGSDGVDASRGGGGTGGTTGGTGGDAIDTPDASEVATPSEDATQGDVGLPSSDEGDGASEGGGDARAGDAQAPYDPCPAKGKPCVALPLGDSITQGAGSTGGGYRVELFHQAVSHGKSLTFVGSAASGPAEVDNVAFPRQHEGHGGYTIDGATMGLLSFITDNNTITTFKPDIVMLQIGTNNLKDAGADVPGTLASLGKLVDKILADDSHLLLIVAQIIPMRDDTGTANVRTYNAGIPALVKARADAGKHITTADIYSAFVANPNYKADYLPASNVHPNDAGYKVMGAAWYGAVGPLLR
jgi:lysophospholipase L1-like esterase